MDLILLEHIRTTRPQIESHFVEVHDSNNPPNLYNYMCALVGSVNLKSASEFQNQVDNMLVNSVGFVTPGLDKYRMVVCARAKTDIRDHERIHYFLRAVPAKEYFELLNIIGRDFPAVYDCWVSLFKDAELFLKWKSSKDVKRSMTEEMLVRTVNGDWYLDINKTRRDKVPQALVPQLKSCKSALQNQLLQLDSVVQTE